MRIQNEKSNEFLRKLQKIKNKIKKNMKNEADLLKIFNDQFNNLFVKVKYILEI